MFLAEQGLDVLSVDFSPLAQAKARKLAKERGVTLRIEQADIINWDWPKEEFDVVAAIFFQFALPPERDKIFAGIKKTLKPGGLAAARGLRAQADRIQDRRAVRSGAALYARAIAAGVRRFFV